MARLRGERALEHSGWHRGAKAVTCGGGRNNPNIDTINTNLGNQRLTLPDFAFVDVNCGSVLLYIRTFSYTLIVQ